MIAYTPGDEQTALVLLVALPWRKYGYQARLVVILAGAWRVWRWRAAVG